ncbi:MAG TPA: double-strand break repair protein AddB [Rhizomicrobium sp.]
MAMNVFTIPPGAAFADLLARGAIEQADIARDPFALADITIFVPTRRATRTLREAFARALGGAALLPDIRPLGDIDEEKLLFDATAESLSLPQAIDPVRRRLLLAALIGRWDRARNDGNSTFGFAQAAALARSLAQFIDEAETQNADLSKLDSLAEGMLAGHWQLVKDFLGLVREEWPKLMAVEGAVNPAARRNLALGALTQRYRDNPPRTPVIAAGTTGSIPATAGLLRAIAALPKGAVVLPGLDRDLDDENWGLLDEGHPQFGMKQLLENIGIERGDVRDWSPVPTNAPRALLLRETLRPAPTTDGWRAIAQRGSEVIAKGLEGLSLVEAAHPAEEATAIALILREALEQPRRTAALVTPDRNLARRVAAELGRWSIAIDDSAGRPLANTPPGTFLALLAGAAAEEFAAVPLLALLKHPLAAGGQDPVAFRRRVRELDRFALRGTRPDPGLDGISRAIAGARARPGEIGAATNIAALAAWWHQLAALLRPFADAIRQPAIGLGEIVGLHARTAEALAATGDETGAARLWAGSAGEVAGELTIALDRASSDIPAIAGASWPALFRMFAEERAVRPAFGSHPRLAILGPLEARLQHFDVLVLGGLNEGTWPQPPAADPWLSRPMRKSLGLESPERRIGLAAHDFATLAAGPRVWLTRSLKTGGAPAVASRWIERLKQLAKGLALGSRLDSVTPFSAYAANIDLPTQSPVAEPRPAPRPPLHMRPRGLSVTEIETWLRDPYAIYAKHVLKLRPLEALDAEIGPLERGSAVHLVLERFLKESPDAIPANAIERLLAIADAVFAEMAIPAAALVLWRPRFARAAAWFLDVERKRRVSITRSYTEITGRRVFTGPGGDFVLRGRADRIDVLKQGGAALVDYKTGLPPSSRQVEILIAPQLPLEGVILAAGGFEGVGALAPAELIYLRMSGGPVPGELRPVKGDIAALVQKSAELLATRIAQFDDESFPYLPRKVPFRTDIAGDYDHLARVGEWSSFAVKDDAE